MTRDWTKFSSAADSACWESRHFVETLFAPVSPDLPGLCPIAVRASRRPIRNRRLNSRRRLPVEISGQLDEELLDELNTELRVAGSDEQRDQEM